MQKLIRRIQSPTALFAFEAAARHLSFTRAAAELNVSQPAVSHAVKRIEQALGVALFHRRHRVISLTDAGERFYNDVSFGLMQIWQSAEKIALQSASRHVTLSASTAFANYWMVPRLADFKAAYPQIDIRLQATDKDIEITGEANALAIRRGDGAWEGYEAAHLAAERIFPVCSPAYLAKIQAPGDPVALTGHNLIHLEEPYRPRPAWADWFAAQGVAFRDRGEGLRLNDYALVLQAAMAGEGIAMGWDHVTQHLIRQGLLVRVLDSHYAKGLDFYVIWPKATPLSVEAGEVLMWLLSQRQD
ncbi:MAG: LysR substrate-binding domain-containing protein [Pseudomonadota bacterium]